MISIVDYSFVKLANLFISKFYSNYSLATTPYSSSSPMSNEDIYVN